MKLTYSAFLKAAKRSAARTGEPLAQAQKHLAADFGFKSLDALRKGLAPSGGDTPASRIWPESTETEGASHQVIFGSWQGPGLPQPARPVWQGLSKAQLYRLLSALIMYGPTSAEGARWKQRSHDVLRPVLHFLAATQATFTIEDLELALKFESIEHRCLEHFDGEAQVDLDDQDLWSRRIFSSLVKEPARGLARYLESTSGYQLQDLLKHRDRAHQLKSQRWRNPAHETHIHLLSMMSTALEALRVLEQEGVMTEDVRLSILDMHQDENERWIVPQEVLSALDTQEALL